MQVEAYFGSVENTRFFSFANYNSVLPCNSYSINEYIFSEDSQQLCDVAYGSLKEVHVFFTMSHPK